MSSSSYTTLSPTISRRSLGLRIMMARLSSLLAYSGYFIGMSMRSSSVCCSSCGMSLSRSIICCAADSVIIVDMMHVKRIIITTALSISSFTSTCPGAVSILMPTIIMAIEPAACAEVSPNIMLPDESGRRNRRADRYAAIALPKVPMKVMASTTHMMPVPAKSRRTLMSIPTPMRK